MWVCKFFSFPNDLFTPGVGRQPEIAMETGQDNSNKPNLSYRLDSGPRWETFRRPGLLQGQFTLPCLARVGGKFTEENRLEENGKNC